VKFPGPTRPDNRVKGHRRHTVLICVCAAVFALIAAAYYLLRPPETVSISRQSARAAIPVSVAFATRQDVPVYLTGLGTVQASFTVDIRAKVDGELQQVLFTEGQHVKKGDLLAKIDPRLFQATLDQARAKRAQDEALLRAAEKDLARFKTLVLKNIESQQNVDRQQGTVDQLKAAVDADVAVIEAARTNLDYTNMTAPSAGRIGIRLVDPGNMLRASDPKPIANLVLTQPCAVLFTLPATNLADLRAALKRGHVEVTAFDHDNRIVLSTGKLLLIDNAMDQATATMRLKAIFANTDDVLWPGEFVNARVLLETRHDVITVPTAAIQSGPQGLFTWVVSADNTAHPRAIVAGPEAGDLTIVTAGLSDGDRVVIAGRYKLQPKATVTVAERPVATDPGADR
jgi:membrane fusion protein, multidrug efflux system